MRVILGIIVYRAASPNTERATAVETLNTGKGGSPITYNLMNI